MNTLLLLLIGIPIVEIYLFIKIGAKIGAFNTILLILTTAILGVSYAKYEGLNTLKSATQNLIKNSLPIYEIISGATLGLAAILLILPGFATDSLGIVLIIPFTRKIIIRFFQKKVKKKNNLKNKNFIEGEYEDIEDK
tara:strand:- start:239 stop:652 length:414 start_codon:yes stop_codon:yes gene_type:complete